MRDRNPCSSWRLVSAGLVALLTVAGSAWAQQAQQRSSTSSSKDQSKAAEPVVRTFGTQGGYRTELKTRTEGNMTEEDRRQAALLMAEVFQHIEKAREKLDADDTKEALKEVKKSREAIKAIRAMLPKTIVHTKTTAPDGKTVYEDEREVQDGRIPMYEGMLHAQTLAPILASRRTAQEIVGVQLVESQAIATAVIANIDPIEGQLEKAAKALESNKTEDASKALAMALVRGLDVRFSKEDSELASARDAIWLARRSLEENNVPQAMANLAVARERLQLYRQLLSQDQRKEVDEMLREVEQLESQLRQEGNRQVTSAERARQGSTVTHWWDRVNSWLRRHL